MEKLHKMKEQSLQEKQIEIIGNYRQKKTTNNNNNNIINNQQS